MFLRSIVIVLLVFGLKPTAGTAQDPYMILSQEGTNAFFEDLFCNYEVEVSEVEVKGFVNNLLYDTSNPCNPLIPYTVNSSNTAHSFAWDAVAGAEDYTVAYFGLTDGASSVKLTDKERFSYSNLSPQAYLFFFITNCPNGASVANIIITDKDVFHPVNNSYDPEGCSCYLGKSDDVAVYGECDQFTQHFFPWDNNCFGNKYKFEIDNIGEGADREFWLLHGESEDDHMVVVLECSQYVVGNEYINDPGNYWAHFNANGVHIYITNANWASATVTASKCECYSDENMIDEDIPIGRLANEELDAEEIKIWPNPATDYLVIQAATINHSAISIVDANGKQWSAKYDMTKGRNDQLQLDTSDLPAGIYYIQIESKGTREVKRIVKI